MALPTNDDFANCELSTEELDAIAAGWPHWLSSAVHAVEDGLKAVFTNKYVAIAGGVFVAAGMLVTGGSNTKLQ
jgi:hypothetical protein